MNYMDCEGTIADIVESMLPRFSNKQLGLNMRLDIGAHEYSDSDSAETNKKSNTLIQFIFIRPNNYTKVFTHIVADDRRCFDSLKFKANLTCDHDSCWRIDGLRELFMLIHKCCSAVNPDKPFAELNPFIRFNLFSGRPTYVLLKDYKIDRDERTCDIEIIKTLTVKEASTYMKEYK